jgi:erythrin-vacuolar iron transport family protein
MASSEGLSDTGELTGHGSPYLRGAIPGFGTFLSGALPGLPGGVVAGFPGQEA